MKVMYVSELRDLGVLQEINRQFLHPIGLSMMVDLGTNGISIVDNRDDPEGVLYETFSMDLMRSVARLHNAKVDTRVATGLCDARGVQQRGSNGYPWIA